MSYSSERSSEQLSINERYERAKIHTEQSDPQKPVRLVVCGSRGVENYAILREKIYEIVEQLGGWERVELVCGKGSRGVDDMAYHFVRWDERDRAYRLFEADWDRFDKQAGPHRSEAMIIYASQAPEHGELLVIWDGESKEASTLMSMGRRYKVDIKTYVVEPQAYEHFHDIVHFHKAV